MSAPSPRLAAVVIGRNEGERLQRCLAALLPRCSRVVYVDSASTDGSVAHARRAGAEVIELDLSIPFTAARARNAGLAALAADPAPPEFIQFIDGDCELRDGWLGAALDALQQQPRVVAVCGRRRERHPEASRYNLLCDLEWNTPVGLAAAFGGDALVRFEPLRAAGGYRESMIAGEEPELALRLRQAGWSILRLDHEMCWHDAAIHRFSQWWRRAVRAGHAYAEGFALHGTAPHHHKRRELRRVLLWGLVLPLGIALATAWSPWALWSLLVYPAQWIRLGMRFRRQAGHPAPWLHACFLVIGSFAETWGALKYLVRRLAGGPHQLIEYK